MMENSRTELSMSIASFRKLRENDLLYVDKTRFIKTLEDLGIRHALLTRPRRFGKSLFLSTLETYYDRNEAENFDRYFAGTFIGAHPTATQGQYAVFFFDLSGIDRTDFNHAFCRNLISSFTHFYHHYKIEALRPLLSRGVTDSTSLMQGFFHIVSEHLPLKLMVLIDEYDHTANDLLEHGPEAFPAVAKREALLAGFYAEIENAVTSGVIARSFITGVTRLSKYPVATGFPSAADITEHESFADLYGFTAEELRDVIRTTRSDKKLPMSADEIETRMTDAYCGYRFSPSSDLTVLNPEACIYYLRAGDYKEPEASPVKPRSILTDDTLMDTMFRLGDTASVKPLVTSVLQGVPLPAPAATGPTGNENRNHLTNEERLDLFRCMGFLTYSTITSELVVPNKYMAHGFASYFLKQTAGFSTFCMGNLRAREIAKALTNGDIRPLFDCILSRLKKDTETKVNQYPDDFLIRTALRAAIYLNTDYRWTDLGTSGFGLLPVAGNAPAYAVGLTTINAEEQAADAVAQKLAAAETELKQAAELHPLNTDAHVIRVTVVFADFKVATMRID